MVPDVLVWVLSTEKGLIDCLDYMFQNGGSGTVSPRGLLKVKMLHNLY